MPRPKGPSVNAWEGKSVCQMKEKQKWPTKETSAPGRKTREGSLNVLNDSINVTVNVDELVQWAGAILRSHEKNGL